jgi:hypothetical protein
MTFTIIDFKAKMTVGGFNPAETYSFIHSIAKREPDCDFRIVSENDCAEYTVNAETDWDDFLDWISLYI